MPSPPNSSLVSEWFQRLDAAWKRMPAEEKTRQREEVQQHLEALAAAHEELGSTPEEAWKFALDQFGNPAKIGRKVYQEWRQSRTGFRTELGVILFGVGCLVLLGVIETIPLFLWATTFYGGTFIVYIVLGRKYPFHAVKGAFYLDIARNIWWLLGGVLVSVVHMEIPQLAICAFHLVALLLVPFSMLIHFGIAYLASVTKRGWYRPTVDDFKLTLPNRRRQVE